MAAADAAINEDELGRSGASLLFGFINHFGLDSADYVMAAPEHDWRHAFVVSDALVADTVLLGLLGRRTR